MGRSVNKAMIIGTLGKDPEMKFMPNGNAVVTISAATDESYNDKNTGQKVEATEWHRLTAFGKLAEIIGQYLKKGSKAYFEGKLKTNEYEKDGIKRYSTEIVISEMTMLDANPNAGQQPTTQPQQGGFAPQQQAPQQGSFAPQQQSPQQQGGFQQQYQQQGQQQQAPQQPQQHAPQGNFSQPQR
ncbi:MAG: single-stranded DNA-binding protein [Oleispira sp.]